MKAKDYILYAYNGATYLVPLIDHEDIPPIRRRRRKTLRYDTNKKIEVIIHE